jgi:DNA-binding CsgD family transcriptional regulator
VRTYIIVTEGVATLLLVGLAGWLAAAARRGPRGAFRVASAGASAACVLLGVTSFQHLLHLATRDELVSSGWGDMLLGPLAAVRATTVVLAATLAVILGLRHWTMLGKAQSMVDVLTDRLLSRRSARQAVLSVREVEVHDLIKNGVLSDEEIGESLHISPATAATHVQNILRKTDLHNRRDLMLLGNGGSNRESGRGTAAPTSPSGA